MANISQNPCRYGQLMPFLLSKDIGDIDKDIGVIAGSKILKYKYLTNYNEFRQKGYSSDIVIVTFTDVGKGSDYR